MMANDDAANGNRMMSLATSSEQLTTPNPATTRRELPRESFDAIYATFHKPVFGLAYRMMGNAEEASDATQETFISVYQHLHRFTSEINESGSVAESRPFSAWLFRIATNKCIDALRRRNRRFDVDWDAFAATSPAAESNEGCPELFVLDREQAGEVQIILDQMSPSYRLGLLLYEHQGLSVREVAQVMGRTEAAIKSLLFRAREQFRTLYEQGEAVGHAA